MAAPRKIPSPPSRSACKRAAKLLNEKVLDVLERLLEASDDKLQLAAAKEIKEIAKGADEPVTGPGDKPSRVFVVTGIDRKPGDT